MWSKLKSMPVWAKVALGILVLGVIYRVSNGPESTPVSHDDHQGNFAQPPNDGTVEPGPSGSDAARSQAQAQLQSLQARHAELMAAANQCMAESNQATQQTQISLAQGGGMVPQPPCVQNGMPQWTAEAAMLEKEIYALQTGDTRSQVRDFVPGLGSSSSSPSHSPSYPLSDDGTGVVERGTRQAIRGTTDYTDQRGDQYERPTRNYYFRDRVSGAIVGSDLPNPPDYSHDWEQLTPE